MEILYHYTNIESLKGILVETPAPEKEIACGRPDTAVSRIPMSIYMKWSFFANRWPIWKRKYGTFQKIGVSTDFAVGRMLSATTIFPSPISSRLRR